MKPSYVILLTECLDHRHVSQLPSLLHTLEMQVERREGTATLSDLLGVDQSVTTVEVMGTLPKTVQSRNELHPLNHVDEEQGIGVHLHAPPS